MPFALPRLVVAKVNVKEPGGDASYLTYLSCLFSSLHSIYLSIPSTSPRYCSTQRSRRERPVHVARTSAISLHLWTSSRLVLNTVNININFLVVETNHPFYQCRLTSRIAVPPRRVLDLKSIDSQVVVLRHSFVRANRRFQTRFHVLPVDLVHIVNWSYQETVARLEMRRKQLGCTYGGFWHIMPCFQHRLEKEHVHSALRDHDILQFDGDGASRR